MTDERFSSPERRAANRHELEGLLEPFFATKTSQQVHLALESAAVPSEIPLDTHGGETVLHDEENLELGLVVKYEHPLLGSMRQFGHLVTFSDTPGRIAGPPPLVGEHTRDILAWAGFGPEAVDQLKQSGVVAWPEESVDYPWSC